MSALFSEPGDTAEDFAAQIDTVITSIYDSHCPLKRRSKFARVVVKIDGCSSDDAVDAERKKKRRERKWNTSFIQPRTMTALKPTARNAVSPTSV